MRLLPAQMYMLVKDHCMTEFTYTDFKNGLADASAYLQSPHHVNASLTGSIADTSRYVISAEIDVNLKEMICSLLAGRGLKLPNVQICISLNLRELLKIPQIQGALFEALNSVADVFDKFLDHTQISQVLGRINNVLAEVQSVASMINFCSSYIDPVAVPNLLESSMQSFLGTGKELIDRLGYMIPENVGACLSNDGFNAGAFSGGIIGKIATNYDEIIAGTIQQSFIDSIVNEANQFVIDMERLIENETTISSVYKQGGSDFSSSRPINTNIGVLHNATEAGIQGNTSLAGQLKALYDNLGSYQVIDNDGVVYNNIFELFVEPGLLSLLRNTTDPTPEISEQQPVYSYCGEIVGYTKTFTQQPSNTSVGTTPETITEPGFNAAGITQAATSEASVTDDAEVTEYVTTLTTVSALPIEILFDNKRVGPTNNTAWFVEMQLTGKRSNGVGTVSLRHEFMLDNSANIMTISNFYDNISVYGGSAETSAYAASAETVTGGYAKIMIAGSDGHEINWAVRVKFQEA
jgi:hypothetical protein